VTARVHNGPDAPLVRLQWYPTDLPFLPIDKQIVINNRVWDTIIVEELTVGELPIGENDYEQDGPQEKLPGLVGQHMCHPEWLEVGEPWPNDLPPTEYNCYGVPLCCNPISDPTCGGIEIGGEAGDRIIYVDPTEGGVEVGGANGDQLLYVDPTEGGVEVGGANGDQLLYVDPTEGGVEVGGNNGDPPIYIDPTEGGIEVGGNNGDPPIYVDPTEGGVEVGGASGDQLLYVDPTEGGVEVGGASGDQLLYVDPTEGGVEVGGNNGDQLLYVDPTEGGIEVGGASGDQLLYVDPTEGGVEVGGASGDVYNPGGTADTYIADGTVTMNRVTPGVEVWADAFFNYVLGRNEEDNTWDLSVNDPVNFFQPDPPNEWDGTGCETFFNIDGMGTPTSIEVCAA